DELTPAKKEYDAIDKEVKAIKEFFPNMEEAFCGDFHIVVKKSKTTKYEIPEEIKQQYATPGVVKKMEIKRIGE
ncbi:MAG: hypothetical protein ABII25_00345, partial [bacterium]